MKNIFAFFLFLIIYLSFSNANYRIETFDFERDMSAILQVLNDNSHYLKYETLGYPSGYTLNFFLNNNYVTDVIRVNAQTIGFVNYAFDFEPIGCLSFKRTGLLHLIGIDNFYQGQGYGKALLEHVMQRFNEQNVDRVILAVRSDNAKAQAFYQKAGFSLFYVDQINNEKTNIFYKKELRKIRYKIDLNNFCTNKNFAIWLALGLSFVWISILLYEL